MTFPSSSSSSSILMFSFQSNTTKTCFVLIFLDKPSFPLINSLKICCRLNCSYRVAIRSTIQLIPFHNLQLRLKTQLPVYIQDEHLGHCLFLPLPVCHFASCWYYIIYKEKFVREKMEISQNVRVVLSVYEVA